MSADCRLVNGIVSTGEQFPIPRAKDCLTGTLPQPLPKVRISKNTGGLPTEVLDIVWIEEQASFFRLDELPYAANVTAENRLAKGHSLKRL